MATNNPENTLMISDMVNMICRLDFVQNVVINQLTVVPLTTKIDVEFKDTESLRTRLNRVMANIPDYKFTRRFILDQNIFTIQLTYREEQ